MEYTMWHTVSVKKRSRKNRVEAKYVRIGELKRKRYKMPRQRLR